MTSPTPAPRDPLPPGPPRYRLARLPGGEWSWWDEHQTIPRHLCNVQFADDVQCAVIARLKACAKRGDNPSDGLLRDWTLVTERLL